MPGGEDTNGPGALLGTPETYSAGSRGICLVGGRGVGVERCSAPGDIILDGLERDDGEEKNRCDGPRLGLEAEGGEGEAEATETVLVQFLKTGGVTTVISSSSSQESEWSYWNRVIDLSGRVKRV